jgi:hypothetical protein
MGGHFSIYTLQKYKYTLSVSSQLSKSVSLSLLSPSKEMSNISASSYKQID